MAYKKFPSFSGQTIKKIDIHFRVHHKIDLSIDSDCTPPKFNTVMRFLAHLSGPRNQKNSGADQSHATRPQRRNLLAQHEAHYHRECKPQTY